MQRGRSRSPVRRDRSDSRRRQDLSVNGIKFNPSSDKMVYVTNLNFNMDWKELKDIIREHAEVQVVEILKNNDGKSKGVALVEMVTKDGANKCIAALHRANIGGRNLSCVEIRDAGAFLRKIKEDTGADLLSDRADRPRRNLPTRDRRSSPGLPLSEDTYGLSLSFLDSLNVKVPLVNRVFVTNISYTCSVGKLYDCFLMAGRITWFDLQLDNEGKSRGMAIVEYSHPIEAVQAVSMLHNQRLLDRTLTVKMDRFEKEPDKDRHGLPNGLRNVGMGLGAGGAPLKDISSIIGQVQQPSMNVFSNGAGSLAPLIQPSQSSFAYQPLQQPPMQLQMQSQPQMSAGFEQPIVQSYQQQAQPIHQPSPVNTGYYSQNQNYQVEQSSYKNPSPYVVKSENGGGNVGGNASRNSYSSNVQSNRQPAYSSSMEQQPASRIILIKNLPDDYTWNVISQRLRQFGDVDSIELISSGVAKVRFVTVSDAERARTTLNGTMVENNLITVDVY